MQPFQRQRIWHSKRPLFMGVFIVTILVSLIIIMKNASDNLDSIREADIQVVTPSDINSLPASEIATDIYKNTQKLNEDVTILTTPDEGEDKKVKEASSDNSETFSLKIGETKKFLNNIISVTSVLEDSRCPQDVQCIQAGKIIINTKINNQLVQLETNKQANVSGIGIMLLQVNPQKMSGNEIRNSEYLFTLTAKKL